MDFLHVANDVVGEDAVWYLGQSDHLEGLLTEHGREISVWEAMDKKQYIEFHGLPCNITLIEKRGFISLALTRLPGWTDMGSPSWRQRNSDYVDHITVGWYEWLTSAEKAALHSDWARFESEANKTNFVLRGKFSSPGSLRFDISQESIDALGPLFSKWHGLLDKRPVPVHCSMWVYSYATISSMLMLEAM